MSPTIQRRRRQSNHHFIHRLVKLETDTEPPPPSASPDNFSSTKHEALKRHQVRLSVNQGFGEQVRRLTFAMSVTPEFRGIVIVVLNARQLQ